MVCGGLVALGFPLNRKRVLRFDEYIYAQQKWRYRITI
jgi:hypothetical protein